MKLLNHLAKTGLKKNYQSLEGCSTKSLIKFKATMLKSRLCDYKDAYKLMNGIETVFQQGANADSIAEDPNHKQVIFKNCPYLLTAPIK